MSYNPTFQFSHAITRRPSASIVNGLRAEDTGTPDLALMQQHHNEYVGLLRETGADVTELEALEAFPDSVFVEDDALCLPGLAVLMRPGAPSRLGEVEHMAPALRKHFNTVAAIEGPGFIEGGDILLTDKEILVGKSARTDSEGIAELTRIVEPHGHVVREVDTPAGVLHFKTDCSLLGDNTILSTKRLDASGCFAGYRVIHTEDDEEAAANTIRFNQFVIMPSGFPKTAEKLMREGFEVRQVGNSECAKLDGGMSCLSLRFNG
jgi:dimethylargininase